MKKEVNIFWVLTVLLSVAILIFSSLECVEGISHSSFLMLDDTEPIRKGCNLIYLVCIPTVFSAIALFFENSVLNVLASITLIAQAGAVAVSYKVYDFIDNVFCYIGSHSFAYRMTDIGVVVSVLCWVTAISAVVTAYTRSRV